MRWKRIVAVGAHADDIELGCSGLLNRIVTTDLFEKMVIINFTKPNNADWTFDEEIKAAIKAWGFKDWDARFSLQVNDYPVRRFDALRQPILDHLFVVEEEMTPDLVLIPSRFEIHQDHQVVTQEASRAFRSATILGYEMPTIGLPTDHILYVALDKKNAAAKIEAMEAYKSQKHRRSANIDAAKALMRLRGNQCGAQNAEAYEVMRWIIR